MLEVVEIDFARIEGGVGLVPVGELNNFDLESVLCREPRRLAQDVAVGTGRDADL